MEASMPAPGFRHVSRRKIGGRGTATKSSVFAYHQPAMEKLIHGVAAFVHSIHRGEKALFEKLATAQSPDVLFVTCSDSRIDPSLMTQTKPGEMFVVRNAGNIVPPPEAGMGGEAASIEYAVSVLGVKDVIVCGHSDCGAMKAVMNPEVGAGLSAVPGWLAHAGPTRALVARYFPDASPAMRELAAIELNVLVQIEHLRLLPFVRDACEAGRLAIHAWLYDIGAGEIRAFDSVTEHFVPITDRAIPLEGSPVGTPADWPL
jgi:carbonic anhydrase